MPFQDAAVLQLAVVDRGLRPVPKDQLGLRPHRREAEPTGETVLVWGGSTSVGSNAIQLAATAGYEVITTAPPRNFDYVKSLGPWLAVSPFRHGHGRYFCRGPTARSFSLQARAAPEAGDRRRCGPAVLPRRGGEAL